MRGFTCWPACALAGALLVGCGDDSKQPAGAPVASERPTAAAQTEPDTDPPMPSAGTVLERANGLRISIETAGKGRAARVGRTIVFHQRTRALPAAPSTAADAAPSPSVAESPQSSPAPDADSEPEVAASPEATTEAPVVAAESRPSEPIEISSTWRSGVPLSAVLGRGQLIPGLEQALEGVRAGSRLSVHVPPALAGAPIGGADAAANALEIELEVVEVR